MGDPCTDHEAAMELTDEEFYELCAEEIVEQPTAAVGEPFVNGSFEVSVTGVELGLSEFQEEPDEDGWQPEPTVAENGQFVMVAVTATNIDAAPASFDEAGGVLIDDKGREFTVQVLYNGIPGHDLGGDQQPDTTRSGFLVFDVPESVTGVWAVEVQSDPFLGTENLPTLVEF